jgi:hypothetical protein
MLESTDEASEAYFNKEFFPAIEKGLTDINQRYIEL